MRFWDSSALLAVLGYEGGGRDLAALLDEDPRGMIWLLTPVEVRSGLARRARAGAIGADERDLLWEDFGRMRESFAEVDAVLPVRDRAQRLLDLHSLRSADALQLAAAMVGSEGKPDALPFVTIDRRLAQSAAKEGFRVLPPPTDEGFVAEVGVRSGRGRRTRSPVGR